MPALLESVAGVQLPRYRDLKRKTEADHETEHEADLRAHGAILRVKPHLACSNRYALLRKNHPSPMGNI